MVVGIEYRLGVPEESRSKVANLLSEQLPILLARCDPKAGDPFPNVYVRSDSNGVYLCDNLTDTAVSAAVFRRVIDLMLLCSQSVSVAEE
jgi:hypothetical protein